MQAAVFASFSVLSKTCMWQHSAHKQREEEGVLTNAEVCAIISATGEAYQISPRAILVGGEHGQATGAHAHHTK